MVSVRQQSIWDLLFSMIVENMQCKILKFFTERTIVIVPVYLIKLFTVCQFKHKPIHYQE